MATKCKLEFDDYSEVVEPSTSANVHSMITCIPPVKIARETGNNFFDGEVWDGNRKLCFVGFESPQHKLLNDLMKQRKPLQLKDCQIQPGKRDSSKLEVKLKGTTKFVESPKKFYVAPTEYKSLAPTMEITIQEVSTLTEYERVNAKVKVLVCEKPTVFASDKTKQEVTVSDESGTACVMLWEENVDKLNQGECYQLKGFVVREYGGKKYLAFGREGSKCCLQPNKYTFQTWDSVMKQ